MIRLRIIRRSGRTLGLCEPPPHHPPSRVPHLTRFRDRCHTLACTHPAIIDVQGTWGFTLAKGTVSIIVERCKSCGFCVEFCPTKVLALSSAFNSKGYHPPHVVAPEKCSGCDLCGMYCPDFAIWAHKNGTTNATAAETSDES